MKSADALSIRIKVIPQIHDGVTDGEDEGDGDLRCRGRCGDYPRGCLFESVDKTFPPIVVLRENYEGLE